MMGRMTSPSINGGSGSGPSRSSRRDQRQRHSLEKRFVCFALSAIAALFSYAVLHTRYVDLFDDATAIIPVAFEMSRTRKGLSSNSRSVNGHGYSHSSEQKQTGNGNARTNNGIENNHLGSIPSYHFTQAQVDEQWLHKGRVVRELSHRILSRNIAQSNVVIVSPHLGNQDDDAHVIATNNGKDYFAAKHTMESLYPAKIAIEQGHTTHLIPTSTKLSEGWHTSSGQAFNSTSVGWILLAYFSTQPSEKTTQSAINIDEILAPSHSNKWLQQTTITYLVFPISAKATIPISSILGHDYEYEMDYTVAKTVEMTGLIAAQTLLEHNYKLQLLASSHHFDKLDGMEEAYHYVPNSLFQSAKALHRFLYEQATRVLQVEVNNIRKQHRQSGPFNIGQDQVLEVQFHSLLFATQGLDLAIPARSSYVDVGKHKECIDPVKGRKERCDPKLNARAMNDEIFLECPKRHDLLTVQFIEGENDISNLKVGGLKPSDKNADGIIKRRVIQRTNLEQSNGIIIDIGIKWMTEAHEASGEIEVWRGRHSEHPNQTEAVCVKSDKSAILPSVSCKTRIIPVNMAAFSPISEQQLPEQERPNLLVVMIDPLSKQQLKRSLPNTWALLELLGYIHFPHYMAVGNNSGPNQAALYSGMPLESRQDIRSSSNNKSAKRTWLWDRLNAAGYVTMKAEDGCISNSNMVQSIKPQTHHGQQLHEMFCFSFDRPNCLGGKLAAEHLVDYTRQFINTYNRGDENTSTHAKPWAAFISFIDSHEDSLTLISYLDGILLKFLQDIPTKNTMIVFTSDHGLHYGPTFASKAGEMERAQPLLYMKIPSNQNQEGNQLRQNANKFITAYDLHETMLDVLLKSRVQEMTMANDQLGISLTKEIRSDRRNQCSQTPAIPAKFCSSDQPQRQCNFMIDPPSVFSFYSDIPQNNRPQWPNHCPVRRSHDSADFANSLCMCATNDRDWFDCSNMARNDFQASTNYKSEHYSLRSCGHHELDQSMELDIHVTKNEQLVKEREALAENAMKQIAKTHPEADIKASFGAQPNIIFLEIDSVSLSFSERYFPNTWKLLNQHKMVEQDDGTSCPTGWCAGMFNKTSVVGQSSIVNQLAALSGCMNYNDQGEALNHYKKENGPETHCPAGGKMTFGTDEEGVSQNHWIFDVAKNLGYITFFGEEFCYEDSPYVVQTQSAFTLDVDFTLDKLFCDLAKDWLMVNGKVNSLTQTWAVEYDGKEAPDSCFDGKSRAQIGLEFITQIWDEYAELPKFAFLNALAAHDYSLDAAHASLGAENYDKVVYRFLTDIMSRNDARDTYIVLRSDHGLQGGPYPIDYSTQIEHMHPWTAIIAPANHQSLSIEPFSSNQDMLATGFDIYHSIRYLMSPLLQNSDNDKSLLFDAGIPRWSYNLFQQVIPSRNCQDAKIPKEFCPCTDERSDLAPSFYIGHSEKAKKMLMPVLSYDWKTTRKFAASKLPGVLVPQAAESKYDVSFNREVSSPRCNATLGSYINEEMLQDSWQLIHNITELFPGSAVSGGVFLYPRQTMLLAYLVQREIASRAAKSVNSDNLEPFRICETGFGSGHSAALFLSAAPNVEVVSFDKYDRPHQTPSFFALKGYFGKRLTRVVGDSCQTVKSYGKQCDFLHGSSLCRTDNIDLIQKSGKGVTLTSTAMKSLEDKSVYFGKTVKWAVAKYGEDAQWGTLYKQRCIENIVCFQEDEMILDKKLHLAKGREQKVTHKFCFAVNSGACSRSRSNTQAAGTKSWHKDDFCLDWMLSPPIN